MDVELQILKHLRRDAHPTVRLIDEYCEEYRTIFQEVRNYECFKYSVFVLNEVHTFLAK